MYQYIIIKNNSEIIHLNNKIKDNVDSLGVYKKNRLHFSKKDICNNLRNLN